MDGIKKLYFGLKEWFSSISWCDLGFHEVPFTSITGIGYEHGYCSKCGKLTVF